MRARARALAESLRGYELRVEDAAGAVPRALEREIVAACVACGLFAPNLPVELGGLTNWLWAALWRPPNVLVHATPAQRERYVFP